MVPKLQGTILYVTRRDVQLEQCIVPNVLFSPQNPKMVWITILLRSTAHQNMMSPSSVNFVIENFQEFTLYVNIKNTQQCMLIGSGTRDVDVEHIVGDADDHRFWEELRSCQHFLVDSEIERARHKVFNYAVETLNETIVNEKMDHFLTNLDCAAKVNVAFGSLSKNIEDGWFRYFYAHENNTLLDRSKHVFTHDDLAKMKGFLNKPDVIESCSREKMNTKWRFYKLTNLTVFAALLKDVPMGCMNAVLPEPLPKNHTINCPKFEENTREPYKDNLCVLRALALHMHGN